MEKFLLLGIGLMFVHGAFLLQCYLFMIDVFFQTTHLFKPLILLVSPARNRCLFLNLAQLGIFTAKRKQSKGLTNCDFDFKLNTQI